MKRVKELHEVASSKKRRIKGKRILAKRLRSSTSQENRSIDEISDNFKVKKLILEVTDFKKKLFD